MKKLTQLVTIACTALTGAAWAVDAISINFGSDQTNASMSDQEGLDGGLLKNVPAESWNDFNDASATDAAITKRWTGEGSSTVDGVTVSFSGRGGNWYPHAEDRSTASRFLNGYIDDGSGKQVSITVKNVPYTEYGVIIYYNGDNSGHRFKPVEVNGTRYTFVNGQVSEVASDATSPIWGVPAQTTVAYGKNAIRITGLTATDLTIKPGIYGAVNGSTCRGTVAAVQIFDPSTVDEVVIDRDDIFTASDAEKLDEADFYNLTIPAGGTFTIDADLTRTYNIVSTGMVTLKGANMTADNIAKLNDMTTGFIYRIEGDNSDGIALDFGAGTYSLENAKVTNNPGANSTILVQNGDQVVLPVGGQYSTKNDVSLKVLGGNVQIGPDAGSQAIWYGVTGVSYEQAGGEVVVKATGTGTSGNGNGFLLGWSGALAKMDISGGTFTVANSSINFWSAATAINISGDAHAKTKGVFAGSGSGHSISVSDTATLEIGSLGWTTVPLTLNGGTFKAYESATMAGAITIGGAANIEVVSDAELKLTGSVTGEGVVTKKGEGVLNVGTARPTMDVKEGSVKIVATPTELVAGKLTLPVPEDASAVSTDKVSVWDSEGNEVEVVSISKEGTTVTITLETLPSIDADTTISELELDPAATGLIVVEGGATEEEAITVTFDATLPEGVSMEINGFVKFVAEEGIDIPYGKMTFGEDATLIFEAIDGYTIPVGASVIAGTANGTIVNNGTLTIKGDSEFTLTNTGTLNLEGGVSTITSNAQAIKGTINIAYGATYQCNSNDQVPYGGNIATTVNVHGTLDMQNHRWTLGGADVINLYGGCTVTGEGDNDGLLDLYREGNVINVLVGEGDQSSETVVTIPGLVRARHTNGNIFIDQGMKLALTGGLKGADVEGATVNMNGNGRLTGEIPLKGGLILNLGLSVGAIDARFIAQSGDSALKLGQSAGGQQITTSDSAEEPFLTINSGATLQLYVKDFSSWNNAVTEYGWIKNEGTLNIRETASTNTRYFRGHLMMAPGTTTTIYDTNRNLIVYGGDGGQAKAQLVVPAPVEGGATKATLAGEGSLQFNVNGSAGTPGAAVDVAKGAELEITTTVIGNEPIVKYGAGQLSLTGDISGYTGALKLVEGSVFVPTDSTLTIEPEAGKMIVSKAVEGGTIYKPSLKSFIFIVK